MRHLTNSKDPHTHRPASRPASTSPKEKITSRAVGTIVMSSSVSVSPTQRRLGAGERQMVPIYRQGNEDQYC